MSTKSAYDDWSATYDVDVNLTRDLDQAITWEKLSNHHFESIIEIGCGTGKNTVLFSKIGARVLAVDFSEGMLKSARQKVKSDHVTFCIADIKQLWPVDELSADLVTMNLVLEHVENLSHEFSEAFRSLEKGGRLFVCELHPFRQYQGKRAHFQSGQRETEIPAFVHHISDFLDAAEKNGFSLEKLQEWWHPADQGALPRLVSFMFRKLK